MAAPDSTVWGSIVGDYCRLGIYKSLSSDNTETTVTVQIWFWSKYSCTDTSNTLYYNNLSASGSATTSVGAVSIGTTHDSGSGWSTTNQVKLKEYSYTYTRGTTATTRYLYAKLANIDKVKNTAIYASTTFAVPKLSTYTISYNANGGSGAPSSQTKYYGKALTLSTVKPTKSGYIFQGWATSSGGSVAYASGASYTGNANLSLYAVWKAETYTVAFNANGGTGAPASVTKTYGVTLTLPTAKPTRTNYNFLGWGLFASATTATYAAGGSYTTNGGCTLYAVWELAYTKPRITDCTITRCNSDGTASSSGTYALISFNWASDRTISNIKVEWKSSVNIGSATLTGSGTSGTVGQVVGGEISANATYTFVITVTDTSGYTTVIKPLSGQRKHLDFIPNFKGAAVGKPAELEGVFDIGYQARFYEGILYPVLEPETDLNEVKTPNSYIGANVSTYVYGNCPLTGGTFTLDVASCGNEGQLMQTLTRCSKDSPWTWRRFYYQGTWGKWHEITAPSYDVLYSDISGTAGTVPLSKSLVNYTQAEIFFTDNNGCGHGCTKVVIPLSKSVHLSLTEASSTSSIYIRSTNYTFSETAFTPDLESAGFLKFTNGNWTRTVGANYIKVIRIVGLLI